MAQAETRLTVLLVDDDQVDRMAVRRALLAAELDVDMNEVPDAASALGAIRARSFDCILLDYLLPDRDGIHLLRQLRAEGIQTPVIMLTGHGDECLAVELMKAGACDYIPKREMTAAGLGQSVRHAVRVHRLETDARRAASAHAQQLRSLADAAVELGSVVPKDELMARAARRTRTVLLADVAEARLVSSEPDAELSPRDEALERLLRMLDAPVRAEQAELRARWLGAIAAAGLATPMSSWIAVPLLGVDGEPIGLIHACDKPRGPFSEDDESMLVQLAGMASAALRSGALIEAAEQAARARDEIVAVVSHDLRNPLNTLAMGIAMIERNGIAALEAGVVSRMQRATSRLNRIIDDLLDVTRIDAGTLTLDRKALAPAALVEDVVELLGPQAAAKQVTLDVAVPPHAPTILADRDRLIQVLMNVVGNAVKFTPDGGLVSIAVQRQGDSLRFEVRDNGPGIPAADLPRVFDRFWQARSTAKVGTGLGLHIARGIAEAHGGTMQVESTEGLGTSVAFTVPILELVPVGGGLHHQGAPA